ncbi:MAG: T9SS type A sorting domain-containing protein [Candidatus Electryonea clarkiae]|nr:T9SS type A sorting domain-containing protein [Candidatus Electryonea clarkiae]
MLYFWNDSGTPPNGVLSNLIFENNYIPSSNSYGVAIGGTALGGPIFTDANFGSGNRIHDNAFEMSGETYGYGAVYMADNYTGLLDASDNWWGDAYGPENDNSTYTPPAPLKGRATVSDRVEYAPWYDDGTNAATGRGWVADAGATLFAPVHNVTQDTYHSSIQRGVDGATTSDSISCLAGTFDECVTIDKNIRLAGASSAKGTTYLAPSFAHMDSATVKNVHDSPYPNLPFQSVLLVDYTGTTLTTINDFVIDGSSFNTGTPASSGYFAGIFFDDCAGTVTNITFDDIYTLANKGMGIVIEDDSGTDKTTEIGYCTFNNCPSYGTFVVFPNAIANIHHNSLEGSTSYYGFLSASSTTASVVESNSTSAGRRGVNAYSLSSDVKVDITNNTFDFSGYDPATNYVDMIVSNDDGTGTYSVELDIDGNTFIGNWPLGTSTAYDCKAFNTSGRNIIGTSITNNTFTNINNCLWFADFGAPYGDLTNVVVQNNTFTNISTETIRIGEHLSGIGTMSINYNSFDTNPDYVIHNTSTTEVDAEKNWWGDATGPDDEGDINPHTTPLGGIVTTYVDFIPWYATSTVTTSTEYVMTHSGVTKAPLPRLAYADAIQPGIDAAAGDYYYVQVTDADSPYTEDLVVDNKAYLYGEDVEKDPLVQITGTHVITADDVTFDFFTLTPGSGISGTVITINSASQIIDGTTITGCQFDMDTSPSIGVYVGGGTPTNKVEDTEINYCTFNGPADMISNPFKVGGQYGGSVGCEIAGLLFGENYVNHGSIPINIADKTIIGLDIIYNDFSYTDGVIYFWAEAGTKSPTGQITESTFENNYVDATNSYGVGFDVNANFTGANYGTISVTNNYFDEDIPGDYGFDAVSTLTPTVDLAGYVLDATENWWGSTDGPDNDSNTFNILTQGVEVSDNVDFVQWYDSGAGYDDPGWNPSGNLFAPVVVGSGKADPYYASIQAAVNGASSDDEVVCYEGTFYEDFSVPASVTDLSIHPYGITKDLDDVTIKGQDKVEASLFPLADPNIEILGSGTGLEGFTIVAPTYVEGYYSSGIVVGATNVDIGFNTFINNTVNNTDDISQAIQTYKDVDCSTLEIGDNTFTDNLAKGDWGYEAIYINPGSGETAIFDNEFTGMCLRAITIEDAGPSEINGNTIETTLPPVTDWLTSGAYQGINLQGDLSDIYISDNYIGGSTSDYGFAQGIRLGSDGDTFTDVLIGGALKNGFHNTIKYNTYGILCKSAAGVAINYNVIEGNDVGVQNDDTAVKTVLDATYNYWGAADGPSFTFDYGIGSGSGDEVSEYVDFNPWYEDSALNTLYTVTMSQFLLSINPASPYVDNYFDLRVCAADANGIRDFSYDNLADFSSSHVALSVPEEQLLVDGFKEVTGACISTLPFDAADHLTIYAWEYITNPPDYYSNMTDIVIQELNDPAAPTNVDFADNPGDNGGWILLTYTLSVDDPFYTAIKDNYGVSYYVVEIDTVVTGPDPDWHFLANISCYDNGLGTDEYTALLPAPASDTEYNFRMAAVYNPTKLGGFDENHISYTQFVTKDAGAQSAWQTGSAAPMDNLPAYANMKVFLQGPYSNGVMTDGADKPLTSPYDGETISAFPLPNDQIVDWVYVELRFAATGETVKEANAFLLTDGSLVNVDGKSSLPFFYTTDVDYYLVIQHRNHLAMMSSAPHTFGDFESQATTIDLTSSGSAYNNGFIEVDTGVYAMYDGDANHSELVNVNDAFDLIDHFGMSGYLGSDLNLSGYVNVNDAYELIGNFGVGTSVPGSTLKDGLDVGQNVDFNVPSSTETKTLECTLEIKNVQVIAGVSYSFDVYITRNTEDWSSLGNLFFITETWYSDLALNFNGSALANPVVSGLSPVATGTTVTTPSLGKLSISLTDGGITVPMTETKLLTVTFDVTDPDATSMLSWNTEDTSIINEASGQYYTTDGTLSLLGSDDSTLPVVLSLFTAQYLDNTPTLYWETESETDNMGWFVYRNNEDNFINAQKVSELLDGHGTTSEMSSYTYEDTIEEPVSGDMCYYWLESIDYGGIVHRYSKVAQITIPDLVDPDSGQIDRPEIFGLLQNAPNPFVNGTRIVFNLHQTAQVELKIYNIKGELVKDLYSGISDYKSLQWNGTDDTGKQLSPGIYFYNLTVNGKSQEIKKLILMR